MVRFVLITGKERKTLEFQTRGGDKNVFFPWKWTIGKRIWKKNCC
jgi:hypothetical protein